MAPRLRSAQSTREGLDVVSEAVASARRTVQQGFSRGALRFLNVPHINNRPLKTSLSYELRGFQSPEGEKTEISLL
jgi:hypothetical protein